jgi:hypothetical protein
MMPGAGGDTCSPDQVLVDGECLRTFMPTKFEDYKGTWSDVGMLTSADGKMIQTQIYVVLDFTQPAGAQISVVASTATGGFSVGVANLTSSASGTLYEPCDDGTGGGMQPHAIGTWSASAISIPTLLDVACRPLMPLGHLSGLTIHPLPGPRLQVDAHDAYGSTITGAVVTRVPGT